MLVHLITMFHSSVTPGSGATFAHDVEEVHSIKTGIEDEGKSRDARADGSAP